MNLNKKYSKLAIGLIFSQSIFSQLSLVALGQTTRFVDIESHWAQACIETLAKQTIIGGDREQQQFRPNDAITRVELAVILTQAFPEVKPVQEPIDFVDIPSDYWAYSAIQEANRRGFLSSYIAGVFNPTLEVTRVQVLEALTQGLNYQPQAVSMVELTAIFEDANEIPETAQKAIAAATENWLVVNYPNVKQLNPNQTATRAEVAAMICQALEVSPQTALVPSQYIARTSINQVPLSTSEAISVISENTASELKIEAEETESESIATETEVTNVITNSSTIESNQTEFLIENSEAEDTESEPIAAETEETEVAANSSAIESNQTESLIENSEQKIEIGELETVKVELFYETPEVLQITIIRKGEQRLRKLLTLSSLQEVEDTDRVIDINIVDLDRDKEPEVMIDFVGRDSSNRPLYYSLIYRYSSFAREYKSLKQTWGLLPYQQDNSAINNTPIFISFDRRFSENYQSQTAEHLPVQVWQYQSGEMQDKTSDYAELVQKQTAILWLELSQSTQSEQELQGIIAAYLANKSALGEAEEGWQRVQQIYQGNDAANFFNELRQFLQEMGYSE